MSTSTTSDPLPVPALPSHHASPVETGFAGSVPGIGEYQHVELERRLRNEHELAAVVGRQAESHKQEESAIDLRGFAAGTASGLTKLVVGASSRLVLLTSALPRLGSPLLESRR